MPTALQKIRSVNHRLREQHSHLEEAAEGAWFRRYEFKGWNPGLDKGWGGSSNKFWEVTYQDGKITTRWGKIGSKGQTKTQHGSLYKAKDMAGQKYGKGYTLTKKSDPAKPKPKPKPKPAPKQGRSLSDLIKRATSHTKPATINPKKPTAPKKVGTSSKIAYVKTPGLQGPPVEKGAGTWKRRLEYVGWNYKNTSGKSSKFYEATVSGNTVTFRWGKIGSKGQSKTHTKGSGVTALVFAKAQIAKKMAKGYKKV